MEIVKLTSPVQAVNLLTGELSEGLETGSGWTLIETRTFSRWGLEELVKDKGRDNIIRVYQYEGDFDGDSGTWRGYVHFRGQGVTLLDRDEKDLDYLFESWLKLTREGLPAGRQLNLLKMALDAREILVQTSAGLIEKTQQELDAQKIWGDGSEIYL